MKKAYHQHTTHHSHPLNNVLQQASHEVLNKSHPPPSTPCLNFGLQPSAPTPITTHEHTFSCIGGEEVQPPHPTQPGDRSPPGGQSLHPLVSFRPPGRVFFLQYVFHKNTPCHTRVCHPPPQGPPQRTQSRTTQTHWKVKGPPPYRWSEDTSHCSLVASAKEGGITRLR